MKKSHQLRELVGIFLFFLFITGIILYFNLPRVYLIWNMYLAILPYLFTELAIYTHKGWVRVLMVMFGFFFFPNAIYLFTDFIHFSSREFYQSSMGDITYHMDISLWISYCLTFLCVLFGAVLSTQCTKNFWKIFAMKNPWFQGIFTILLSIPVGLAIYWGRFLRFNSWHVVTNPKVLIKSLRAIGLQEGRWIGIFALTYLVATYIILLGEKGIQKKG